VRKNRQTVWRGFQRGRRSRRCTGCEWQTAWCRRSRKSSTETRTRMCSIDRPSGLGGTSPSLWARENLTFILA
jgi:DTW domain-containing protein YfiP